MSSKEKKLLSCFRSLNDQGQSMLVSYATFLTEQPENGASQQLEQPLVIDPLDNESVVAAMRRLSKSYFMLKSTTLLNQSSSLMSQHIMLGREAGEVIVEIEMLFSSQYEQYCEEFNQNESQPHDFDNNSDNKERNHKC